jgi:hypothetical protein
MLARSAKTYRRSRKNVTAVNRAFEQPAIEERPNRAIGDRAPIELLDRSAALGPPSS